MRPTMTAHHLRRRLPRPAGPRAPPVPAPPTGARGGTATKGGLA